MQKFVCRTVPQDFFPFLITKKVGVVRQCETRHFMKFAYTLYSSRLHVIYITLEDGKCKQNPTEI